MRAALWLLALFGIAAAIALFAGNNQSTVTVYWPPWRIDFSLNLVLLLMLGAFVVLHTVSRGLAALFDLPKQAKRWRAQQKERAMVHALLDGVSHLLAGRFIRAGKLAQAALEQAAGLERSSLQGPDTHAVQALAHLVAAEAAQSLQDPAARDQHLERALALPDHRLSQETREAVTLSAARWALVQRDAAGALEWLEKLPQGAQRRTLALRVKLKAARLARRTLPALDTARLLAKHRAFSLAAGQSIVRGLAIDLLSGAHDMQQLRDAWLQLEPAERLMPEVAFHGARRVLQLGGDAALARLWLQPVWERLFDPNGEGTDAQRLKLIRAIEVGFEASNEPLDGPWLARIEAALQRNPRDPALLYLAGKACLQQQLWGKAQQLLTQAVVALDDDALLRSAWKSLAQLAEQRGDGAEADAAYRRAAGI